MISDGQHFLTTQWALATMPGLAVGAHRARPLAARRRAGRRVTAPMTAALEVRDLTRLGATRR